MVQTVIPTWLQIPTKTRGRFCRRYAHDGWKTRDEHAGCSSVRQSWSRLQSSTPCPI